MSGKLIMSAKDQVLHFKSFKKTDKNRDDNFYLPKIWDNNPQASKINFKTEIYLIT